MGEHLTLDAIKERHDELYARVLQKTEDLTKQDSERDKLFQKVKAFVKIITDLSGTVTSFDDYRWLSDAALKWQSVFSTIFEEPQSIILSQPKENWRPIIHDDFSEMVAEEWIKRQAAYSFYARRANPVKQDNDISGSNDWHNAEVFLICDILEGKIDFARRPKSNAPCISSCSYWRLENIWLKDVKQLMAYFAWIDRRDLFLHHEKDFFNACDHIRQQLLVNEEMKASISEFNDISNYIKTHYLDSDEKFPSLVEQSSELHKLITRKAKRIHETTGSTDTNKNWFQAETYTKMFYENIIPAVMKNDREKVLRVLKAFQYSKMNRFIIINCFETASAIYFLNPNTIKSLWNDSAEKSLPESTVESIVAIDSWPQGFTVNEPCKKRFWFDNKIIGFNGVMLEIEKNALLDALKKVESEKSKKEHIEAIEKLYDQSRLIREETTL